MISTVTTTTVTTVAMLSLGAALGALASAFLILFLATKEVATADTRRTLKVFGRSLDVGIVPLLLSFSLIVFFKVLEILL
jgi:hypothetical protein